MGGDSNWWFEFPQTQHENHLSVTEMQCKYYTYLGKQGAA